MDTAVQDRDDVDLGVDLDAEPTEWRVVLPDNVDVQLHEDDEALRIYNAEPLFKKFADKAHRDHCDSACTCCCIEEDRFLWQMLQQWDDDPLDS